MIFKETILSEGLLWYSKRLLFSERLLWYLNKLLWVRDYYDIQRDYFKYHFDIQRDYFKLGTIMKFKETVDSDGVLKL